MKCCLKAKVSIAVKNGHTWRLDEKPVIIERQDTKKHSLVALSSQPLWTEGMTTAISTHVACEEDSVEENLILSFH